MFRTFSLITLSFVALFSFMGNMMPAFAYVDDLECLQLTDGYLCISAEEINNSIRFSNTITNYTRSDIPQLSCDMQTPGGTILQRNTCDTTISQNGYGDYRIDVTFNTDHATFTYNNNTRRFTNAVEGSSNTNNYNNNNYGTYLDVTADSYTINRYQSIDLSVRAYNNGSTRTNYNGQVRMYVYKRDGSYGFTTASLSDYSFNGNSSYYTFSIYDNGYHTFYDHIAFNSDGEYKVRIEGDNLTADEVTIIVGNGYTNNNTNNNTSTTNFSLTVDDNTPDINQNVYATITALNNSYYRDYNYRNTIGFTIEHKDTSYGSWYNASYSDYTFNTSSYYMGSTEQGLVSSLNILKFLHAGYYRIKAYDLSNGNIYGYTNDIIVNNTTTNNNYGRRFDLTSNNTSLSTNQRTNISITAKDSYNGTDTSYNGRMNFKVYRRIYTTDSWTDITSSTLDNSNYSIYASYYMMPYSYGYTNISSFIKFYSNSYDYRVVVEDNNDPSGMRGEIIYYLRNAGSNNNYYPNNNYSVARIVATIDPDLPKKNNDIDVTLSARDSSNRQINNYSNRVNFVMEKKSSAGSRSRSTASSTDCTLDRTSYTFSSNDNGDVDLNNLVKCKKDGFFRLKITDDNNSSVKGYVYITILTTSKFDSRVAGYTSSQLKLLRSVYTNLMNNINSYENNSSKLYNDSTRENERTDFYQQLYDVVYDRSGKDLTSYSKYQDAIRDFNNTVLSRR